MLPNIGYITGYIYYTYMQVCEVVAMYVPTIDYKVNDFWQELNRNFVIGM